MHCFDFRRFASLLDEEIEEEEAEAEEEDTSPSAESAGLKLKK